MEGRATLYLPFSQNDDDTLFPFGNFSENCSPISTKLSNHFPKSADLISTSFSETDFSETSLLVGG